MIEPSLSIPANRCVPARPLIHNRQGQWFVDTRLRLRGGGPIVLARKATSLAEQRASTLKKQLSNFHEVEKGLQQKPG
ncbi:hypothetical protein PSH87_28175 [Pseudomonas sp. FP453]|uniref:hypothetical protein n=1 Tax=Pseudomonas sp. FP453 TaxID=2954094 RepID=UPI0027338967|nr:hypothetical protein [Pseudomonas sp. FP453]WLH90352.1 hypothetical protein PSH87_28175 [Pseudomonas sp. FP453]